VPTNLEDRLREVIIQASHETDPEKLADLVEEIYRLVDARKKASEPS
jgi:hypothetical protein